MEHWQSRAAIGVGLGLIVGYEAVAPKDELISDEVERTRRYRLGNIAVQALVWSTAAHLSGAMPEKWDWLHRLSELRVK